MNKRLHLLLFSISFFATLYAHAQSDLVVTDAQLNSTVVQAGSTISFNFTLKNKAIAPSVNSYTGIYISSDSSWDASDKYVTSRFNDGLASLGQDIVVDQIITIPQSITPGNYYILLYADYDQDVAESNEINNVIGFPISVEPDALRDLSISSSISTLSIEVGNTATASATLYNNGPGYVGPNYTGMYLSTNPSFDPADILLSYGALTFSLGGNSSVGTSITGAIPENTPPGTYYLLLVADYRKDISESNESNNTSYLALTVLPSSGDRDLSISNLTITPTIEQGGSILLSNKISNNGVSAAGRSSTGYYLSTDNVLNKSTDYLLGTYANDNLSGNTFVNLNLNLSIPSSFAAGVYYVFAAADYTNQVVETNETNNTAVATLTIQPLTKDVAIVSASLSATSVEVGNTLTLNFTLKNLGTGTMPNNATLAVLSSTSTASFNYWDVFVMNKMTPVNTAQTDYSFSATLTIPYGTDPGNYYLVMKTDGYSLYPEINETNNYYSFPVTVLANAKHSDLTITNLTADNATVEVGDYISGTFQFNNVGTSAMDVYTYAGFYFSTDNVRSVEDVFLGGNFEPLLSAGTSVLDYWEGKLPHNVTPGTYYIILHADDSLALAETNETNNDAYIAITLIPPADRDLTVASASLSQTTLEASYALTIDASIKNSGTVTASYSFAKFYLSSNATLDNSDELLGISFVDQLLAGDEFFISDTEVLIGQQTNAGNYYILVVADGDDAVVESDETNNIQALPITILANDVDLSITSITLATTSLHAGDVVGVDFIVNNSGASNCIGSYCQIYLSSNTTLDSQDSLLLDGIPFSDLLPGSSETLVSNNIQLPYNLVSGTYYLLVRTDAPGYVKETNETNNVNYLAILVTELPVADLVVSHFTLSSPTVQMGSAVAAKFYVKNIGDDIAHGNYVSLLLSEDATVNFGDTEDPNYTYIFDLNPGDSIEVEATFEVPTGLQEKTYYLIAFADNLNFVIERNDDNNTASISFDAVLVGTVDLMTENGSLTPELAEAGGLNYVSFSITNKGTASVNLENHAVYFSSDMTLDGTDTKLKTNQSYLIPAGGSAADADLEVLIPGGTADGQYYLILVADDGNAVVETNETNNNLVLLISVVQPGTLDLTISAATASTATILSGQSILVSYTLKNAGLAPLSGFQTGIYFSSDNVYDASDALLTTVDYPNPIDKYYTYDEVDLNVASPTGLANGTYYILFYGDISNTLTEFNEANNVYALPVTIDDALSVANSNDLTKQVRYFPTPSKDEVHFEFADANANVSSKQLVVINCIGEKVLVKTFSGTSYTLDVSSLSAGVYSFTLNGSSNHGKLVVVK